MTAVKTESEKSTTVGRKPFESRFCSASLENQPKVKFYPLFFAWKRYLGLKTFPGIKTNKPW